MKRTPVRKLEAMSGKFFSVVSLDVAEISENKTVDIEMLRVGTFKHKKYGDLEITAEMLETMVENFENDVVGREVSFDWNHKAENASGWLRGLKVADGVLIGTAELTDKGKESIQKKEYGYFSIEYSDDYEDPETSEKYGPTILGGALTNRPFMTKLKKIEFSAEDSEDAIYRYEEEKNMDKDKVVREPAPKDEPKLEEIQEENKRLKAELDEMKKKPPQEKDNKVLTDFINSQKTAMEAMETKIKTLEDRNKVIETDVQTKEEKLRKSEVERICDKLLTSDKHHPVVVAVAKEIMLSASATTVIKMTETSGEGDKKKEVQLDVSIKDALLRLLAAIPATQRADYDEKTRHGDDKQFSEEEETKVELEGKKRAFAKHGLKMISSK